MFRAYVLPPASGGLNLKRLAEGNVDYVGKLQGLWLIRSVGRDKMVDRIMSHWRLRVRIETYSTFPPKRCKENIILIRVIIQKIIDGARQLSVLFGTSFSLNFSRVC